MNNKWNLVIIGAGVVLLLTFLYFVFFGTAWATQENKVYWCHTEPNGNQQTLHLPLQALQNAGHVSAQGNPLHAGDYLGECEEPTPSLTPTKTPCPTKEPSVTPSVEPTKEPEATPSATPTTPPSPHGDGLSDGKSDGKSSCPSCTQTPAGPPNTGFSPYDGQPVGWK